MIKYVTGDATQPQGDGPKIIAHCCNNIGGWGSGFVLALNKRWIEPEYSYREWFKKEDHALQDVVFGLGKVTFVRVEIAPFEIWVANIIGQHGTISEDNPHPIEYEAIRSGLKTVAERAKALGASIHMPRMGCGLAGGEWSVVEGIINDECKDIDVTVYDFKG